MNQSGILYEDEDIIVCHKPAGIATQTARVGQSDMVSEVTNYLASAEHNSVQSQNGRKLQKGTGMQGAKGWKQGIRQQQVPYVGVVHRLDQPVEGILVFAKNSRTAAALGRQITENRMEKYYYAVVCGSHFEKRGTLTDYLLKDGGTNTSRIVRSETKGAKKALLEYEILAEKLLAESSLREAVTDGKDDTPFRAALARIRLHTGRHHQIRVQMSHAGMSLLGDYKYADEETVRISEQMRVREVALCAYRLTFLHPVTGKRMQFQIRPEGKIFQAEEFLSCYV